MKVSIALATFNGESHIEEQLRSYVNQTRRPDELVVNDDCSTDSTIAIVEAFAANAPFPVHIRRNRENLGFINNFNEAILRCTGDLVFLSDQDDVWAPGKLETIVKEFQSFPRVGLVFADSELVNENLTSLGTTMFAKIFPVEERVKAEKGDWLTVLLKRNVVGGATMAFRSEFIRCVTPLPTHLSLLHDGWIALIIASLSDVRFINEPLIRYRQHHEQVSKRIYGWGIRRKQERRGLRNDTGKKEMDAGIVQLEQKVNDLNFLTSKLRDLETLFPNNPHLAVSKREIETCIGYCLDGIEHFEKRKLAMRSLSNKIWLVISELSRGRYHKHSNGMRSAVKDLLIIR